MDIPIVETNIDQSTRFVALSTERVCSRKPALLRGTGTLASAQPGRALVLRGTSRPAPKRPPHKPKRTSFPCLACGKTFPSQQAMAGHCSTHTRARLAGQLALPAAPGLQGPNGTNHMPAVVSYPSCMPFVQPMSNQVVRAPPFLGLHGPNTMLLPAGIAVPHPAFRPAANHIQAAHAAAQHGLGALFSCYTLLPLACNLATGAVPSTNHACSANQLVGLRVDLTHQVGSGGNLAEKRTLLPLVQDGREAKRSVAMDGDDQGGEEGKDTHGLDLELRLCR